MSRLDPDLGLGLAFLAAAALKPTKSERRRQPKPGEPHFIRTPSGTIYHVDAKGTRRRATDEQIAQLRSRAAHESQEAAAPDQHPCVHEVKRGEVCSHPEDAPIHAPAEGCTADGDRCDYPQIHHMYKPEVAA